MDQTVVHFEIAAQDVERLKGFYEGLFGWKIEKSDAVEGIDYWIIETVPTDEQGQPIRPGVNGGLYQKEGPANVTVNYIAVEDIDATLEKLRELGGTIISEKQEVPGVGFVASGRDPEGNPVAMMQPLR
jgi:hypothetical protein